MIWTSPCRLARHSLELLAAPIYSMQIHGDAQHVLEAEPAARGLWQASAHQPGPTAHCISGGTAGWPGVEGGVVCVAMQGLACLVPSTHAKHQP